jgi:putative membrane protein
MMIMNRTFKLIAFMWIALLFMMAISSCGNASQQAGSKESAEEHNDAKFADKAAEKDAQYLVDAYNLGLYEIEASQHAKQKASRADVKNIASEMITVHGKLNTSIEALAGKKLVSLQKGLSQDQLEEIKKCGSKDKSKYDQEYIDQLIKDHEKAIKMSEEAAEKGEDAEVRNLFNGALPELRQHLEMAMAAKDKIK